MKIQSLSICVPAKRCINDCKFCCVKMCESEYKDQVTENLPFYDLYENDFIKRMEFARDNGCNTCMLTGDVEPQQNIPFLKAFGDMNRKLERPFRNIEIQTKGAFVDDEKLRFFRNHVGITTISISVSALDNNARNNELIGMKDPNFNLEHLCSEIKRYDFNLRLSLNVTDNLYGNGGFTVDEIFKRCHELGADQVTFRAMYTSGNNTPQDKWIEENTVYDYGRNRAGAAAEGSGNFFYELRTTIMEEGRYLDTLEYGSDRYSYEGISVVIDTDCMSKGVNKEAVKYLILRPNCKLYSKWDDKGSLIF